MFVSVLYPYIMDIICMCEFGGHLRVLYMGIYVRASWSGWGACMYVHVCMSVCSFGCSLGSFFVATSFKL